MPGGAKLILESYVKQATHRQNNENKVISANIAARSLGMKLGAGLSAIGILTGGVVAIYASPAAGVSIVGATAAVLATSYLKALANQGKELIAKKKIMDKLTERS